MTGWIVLGAVALIILLLCILLLYWRFRRNGSLIDPSLRIETWEVIKDGRHNSNSHLIYWKEEFWLIHANSPYHFASVRCKLMLWKSKDAKAWAKVREFNIPGEDIRDPKFAEINGKLFIYVLKSVDLNPEPYATAYTWSADGFNWAPLEDMFKHEGWLFWNPKTFDRKTWYVGAYWYEHGKSILLKTQNGVDFDVVSVIHNGRKAKSNDRNDETDIGFFDDGTLISTQRLEFSEHIRGDKRACTNITLAGPPYTTWREAGKDYTTRLDGPALFPYNGRVYALGRYNPYKARPLFKYYGSVFARKRTSLFEVTKGGLVCLSDVPSAGDTSYGGVVIKDGFVYACYYTSDIARDWPWLMGMVSPSEIRMVKMCLKDLEALADRRLKKYNEENLFQFIPAER